MKTLSVAIIAFNEERNIARCIDSVLNVADQIVVVDSFSTDKTSELAKGRGAEVYQHPFRTFSEQKNIAISYCNSDYILSLDADECVDNQLVDSLMKIKSSECVDCFYIKRKTFINTTWIRTCGWYPDKLIRLWRNGTVAWAGDFVHESSVPQYGTTTALLQGHILHYSFGSVGDLFAKANKYSTLSAQKKAMAGKKVSFLGLIFLPVFRFLRDYIGRGGFRDGFYGLSVAASNSMETFLKYAKLYELNRCKNND